jgi:hypothetical protein
MAVQYCELSESDIHQRTRGQQIQPVAVAAYYDLTGDELAERIPVHRL